MSRQQTHQTEQEDEDNVSPDPFYFMLWQRIEFYVFLFVGGGLWYATVQVILKSQQFPYHLYPIEIILVIWVPIVILAILLGILDRTVKPKAD
ncbi:hypothetical protein EON65_53265 [archaeon]|nr:MAG: hypothetical protein EON65_53265 [archaeon]